MGYNHFEESLPLEQHDEQVSKAAPSQVGLTFISDIGPCCLVTASRFAPLFAAPGGKTECVCGNILKSELGHEIASSVAINKNTGLSQVVPSDGMSFASILFDNNFWNEFKAERYLRDRDIEEFSKRSNNQAHTYILCPTEWLEKSSMATVSLGRGIIAIVGKIKDEYEGLTDEAIDAYNDVDSRDLFGRL